MLYYVSSEHVFVQVHTFPNHNSAFKFVAKETRDKHLCSCRAREKIKVTEVFEQKSAIKIWVQFYVHLIVNVYVSKLEWRVPVMVSVIPGGLVPKSMQPAMGPWHA